MFLILKEGGILTKFLKILSLLFMLALEVYVFCYVTLSVLPDDEKSSPVLKGIVQFIETDIALSKIVKIDRKGIGDYYIVYKPENSEIQILKKGQKFELLVSVFEKDLENRISEAVYDILLNRIGIPVKNVLLGESIKFNSIFAYADSYLIKEKTPRVIRDFVINYATGEIVFIGNLQNIDKDAVILPLNSFGPDISGPFSPVITSKIKVDYIPTISKVYLRNYSNSPFYTYFFTEQGLYRFSETLLGNSSTSFQINWRSRKTYLAVSEIKFDFENFEQFKLFLKLGVESGKTVVYSFRFPDNKTFKSINMPSVESFDYDYLNKRIILKLTDTDFQRILDEYIIIVDKQQEFTFKTLNISFNYAKPVKEIQVIKRRTEQDMTFESSPKILEISNMPPGVLLERNEVRNGEFLNFTLSDIDGDEVKIINFQSDSSGIQLFGTKILFTNAPVGERKITFKLNDGKSEVSKDIVVKVINTPPEIRMFDISVDGEYVVVSYNVVDPDPQFIRGMVTVENLNSQEYIVKTVSSPKGEVRIRMLPLSGMFNVNLTIDDGINFVSKESQIQYNSDYGLGKKNANVSILQSKSNEKIIEIQKQDSERLDSLKVVYTVSQSQTKPSNFWELINSEALLEIEVKNLQEININANKSGYYHFWFITKDLNGKIYIEKVGTILINQPPQIVVINTGGSGFQAIINISVFEPDNDDYMINSLVKDLDSGQTKSITFEGKPKALDLYFEKAGIYDVEIYATDIFGSESKRERVRVQIPNELPRFSILTPNDTILKPSQSIVLRWELENTKYNLPVTYDVYIGESDKNLTLYTSTNIASADLRIVPGKTYYWKVVAKFSKSLFVESPLCKFSVEKEFIVYKSSIKFSSNILKAIQNPKKESEFYVLLSNGDLIQVTFKEPEFERKKIGTLYSTLGDFKVSDDYLINTSSAMIYIYNLENLSLAYWSNFRSEIIFASVYNDTLVLCTSSQIFLYNLKSKKSSVLPMPQLLSSNIELYPFFDEKKQLLIFPDVSNLVFIDILNQKIVRQELVYSRGNIFYCDMLRDDVVLTIDVYGQMNTYKIFEKLIQFISLNEVGISYPMKVIKLEKTGIIFSKTGKISVYEWDESGAIKSVLNETKENLRSLTAPSNDSIIYLAKNRVEYYKYDNISLLTLLQIKELSTIPVDLLFMGNWLIIQDSEQITFYEIQR